MIPVPATLSEDNYSNTFCRIYYWILVLGLTSISSAQYSEKDFNCPEECGLFSEGDLIGPTLHNNCEALKENPECKELFVEKKEKKKKKKKKKRRKGDTRIVGGVESKNPMPWMVRYCNTTKKKKNLNPFTGSNLYRGISVWRNSDQLSICSDCSTLFLYR